MQKTSSLATLGGGCFWCLEAIFQRVQGVDKVQSGYSGDTAEKANYKLVCSGTTKHAEVVQIQYNSSVIQFKDLLQIFFHIHDPTTLNQQGNDVGAQYRSVIFYHDEEQKDISNHYIQELQNNKEFKNDIVTEVTKFENFYKSEDYHNNYFNDHTEESYCKFVVDPKVRKFLSKYKSVLKPEYK